MTTATYTLERCARRGGGGRGGRGQTHSRACGCILSLEPRGSVEARLRIPALATGHAPTSRSCRTLRTCCPRVFLRGSLRALRALPARAARRATQTRSNPSHFCGAREKISWTMISSVCCLHRVMYEHLVWISVEHRVQIRQFKAPAFSIRGRLLSFRAELSARSPEREGAHVPLLTARTTANMASKISKMMDRTGKTSIFDHGKVRLAKRRKCSDNQPMAQALA